MAGTKNKTPNRKIKFLFLSFFLLGLTATAGAQFSVLILPQSQNGFWYQNEIVPVEIKIINLGNRRETGIRLFVETTKDLAIINQDQIRPSQELAIPELFANQAESRIVFVKATGAPTQNAILSVSYGIGKYSNLASQTVEIRSAPVRLELNQNRFVLFESKPQKVFASFFNDQNKTLSNLQIRLFGPADVDITGKTFQQETVGPFQSIQNAELEFWPQPLATGTRELTAVASYTDSNGFHQTEQRFLVRYTANASTNFFPFLVLILILIFYFVWTQLKPAAQPGSKNEKPKEKK
ncbi:MAG: hypothetical protein V1777_03465 [Candidatus Micrarchaeota archaeon]